jgi:hypothetical protein
MTDCDGSPLEIGDIVRYRLKNGPFNRIGVISNVRKNIGLYMIESSEYTVGFYKGKQNVMKMTHGEAMLWKLENVQPKNNF